MFISVDDYKESLLVRAVRHSREVTDVLKLFPYGTVRALYKLAIGVASTGSFGWLCFFYRIKQWKEGKG